MKKVERITRSVPNLEENVANTLTHINCNWAINIRRGVSIELPERLGKTLSLGLAISEETLRGHMESPLRRLRKFDCHHFVSIGLGLKTIKEILNDGEYSVVKLFKDQEFKKISSKKEFEEMVREKLQDEAIGVFQVMGTEGYPSHSSFVFQAEDELIILGKIGFKNIVSLNRAENLDEILKAYGSLVAVGKYSDLVDKYVVGKAEGNAK